MRVAILKSEIDDNFTKGECYSCPLVLKHIQKIMKMIMIFTLDVP